MIFGMSYPNKIISAASQTCVEFSSFLGKIWTKIPVNEKISAVALKIFNCAFSPSTKNEKIFQISGLVIGSVFLIKKVHDYFKKTTVSSS